MLLLDRRAGSLTGNQATKLFEPTMRKVPDSDAELSPGQAASEPKPGARAVCGNRRPGARAFVPSSFKYSARHPNETVTH